MDLLKRGLRVLVLSAVGGYLVLAAALFVLQRDIVFPHVPSEPFLDRSGAERVVVELPDGGSVPLDLSGPAGAPLVLFFHGNAEQIGQTRVDARAASAGGLRFGALEYPGYGDADGLPSEAALFAAARAGLEWLAAKGEAKPTCVGHSLGSGVAVAMTAEGRCARLVAISPYTSMVAMAEREFPWVPARLLVRDPFDSLSRAPQIGVPTLVIHGRRDNLIPYAMGETLAAAIPGARLVGRDRGHNDVRDSETWSEIAEFIRAAP